MGVDVTILVPADILLNGKQLTVSDIYFPNDYQLSEVNFTCTMTKRLGQRELLNAEKLLL